MHVEAPDETSGTISVPTFGEDVEITVNGEKVWGGEDAAARAAGEDISATLNGDYVELTGAASSSDRNHGKAGPVQSFGASPAFCVEVRSLYPDAASVITVSSSPSGDYDKVVNRG